MADADIGLPPAGCVIVGPNGHGKTSLIEALLYPRVFRSFRGASDREIARFGGEGFWLEVECEAPGHGGTEAPASRVSAGYDVRTRQKRVRVDGVEPQRLADAIGVVRGVVLAPADVVLVCGGPRERRRYLDMVLSLSVRGYVQALGRYRRALAQRIRASGSEAAAWEEVLAAAGADLVAARRTWTERWKERYAEYCEALGEALSREDVKTRSGSGMAYRTSVEGGAEALREALESSRARDRQLGRTTVGPHRDELRLTLGGRDLRTYGSAGQQRTGALALRLVEADTLQESDGPLVLALDDAFAELDEERSRNLGTLIGRFAAAGNQIVAAVPKRDEVPAVAGGLEVWRVNDGVVRTTGS